MLFRSKDVAYLRSSAVKGELVKIVIERVYLRNTTQSFYKDCNFYEDKLKSLYREDELLTLEEAQNIIGLNALSITKEQKKSEKIQAPKKLSKYKNGDILYSLQSAKMGNMQRVKIKDCIGKKIYLDMLNSIWEESDLISEIEAQEKVNEYTVRSNKPFHQKKNLKSLEIGRAHV